MRLLRWLPPDRGRWAAVWRKGLLPTAVGLIGFLAGIHLFFPATTLRERLQAEASKRLPPTATLTLPELSLHFPFRLRCDDVTLQTGWVGVPAMTFDRIELRPTLATLLADPGLVIDAHGADGRIAGTVAFRGAVDLRLSAGRFDLPLPQSSRLRLSGTVPEATLTGRLPLGPQSSLAATLQLDELVLHGGEALGLAAADLPLGRLRARADGAGRGIALRELVLTGGAVEVEASGEVLAQASLAASRVDLALALRVPQGGDPALRGLFDLLGTPAADGLYRLRLHGPLVNPELN